MSKAATLEAPETSTSGEVQEIKLDLCLPSPKNKERPLDAEFLKSLKDKGQQVIALLRPHPDREGFYEIVDGARRQKGLWELGLRSWRAEVRELSDSEADIIRAIANKHRTGLTWWQEAELIEEYLREHGDDKTAAVGAALGMTNGQVLRRKQLLTLTPKWRKSIAKGEPEGWGPGHYELIAAYPAESQDDFHQAMTQGWYPNHIDRLKEWLGNRSKVLKNAPWKLDDATLCPKVGACTTCPHRSGANPDLFGEVDDKAKKDDKCLVPRCWGDKAEAHLRRQVAEKKTETGEAPILISTNWRGDDKKKILGTQDYELCKKNDPGAKLAFLSEGDDKGKQVYIQTGKDKGRRAGQKASKNTPEAGKKSLKERKAEKDKQRDALAIDKFIAYIKNDAGGADFTREAQALLTQYGLARGICVGDDLSDKETCQRIRDFAKKPWTSQELWELCSTEMESDLQSVKWGLHPGKPAADHHLVQLIAWMLEVDFADFRAEALAELPDPKSWAAEEAAGPAKKNKGKKAKASAAVLDSAGMAEEPELEDEDDSADLDDEA